MSVPSGTSVVVESQPVETSVVANRDSTVLSQGTTDQKTDVSAKNSPQIDWETLNVEHVPEEIIRKHPAYKTLLAESIGRRQELAELKAKNTLVPETKQVATPDDRVSKLEQMVLELRSQQESEKLSFLRQQVAKDHHLPLTDPNVQQLLVGKTKEELEAAARALAAALTSAGQNTSAGNSLGTDGMKQRLADRLSGGQKPSSPFDVDVQRHLGGGVINKST